MCLNVFLGNVFAFIIKEPMRISCPGDASHIDFKNCPWLMLHHNILLLKWTHSSHLLWHLIWALTSLSDNVLNLAVHFFLFPDLFLGLFLVGRQVFHFVLKGIELGADRRVDHLRAHFNDKTAN